jgi:hypothetical protein
MYCWCPGACELITRFSFGVTIKNNHKKILPVQHDNIHLYSELYFVFNDINVCYAKEKDVLAVL